MPTKTHTTEPAQTRAPRTRNSGALTAADVLAVQRTAGNRAAQQLIAQRRVQAKLTVGPVDDPYEREADRMADAVLSARSPQRGEGRGEGADAQRETTPEEDELQAKPLAAQIMPLAQREAMPEEDDEVQAKRIQREAMPEEDELQTKAVQRKGDGSFDAGADVEQRIASSKGAGSALPDTTRAEMEGKFGADFSGVRVHAGDEAAQLNRDLSAQAFTHGSDVYFGEGKFSPASGDGKRLLAHELTHVVQQETHESRTTLMNELVDLPRVQRSDSPEHVRIGDTAAGNTQKLITLSCHERDFPERKQPNRWPSYWRNLLQSTDRDQERVILQGLTYGEIAALSGDFYASFEDLDNASLQEIVKLIPLIREEASTWIGKLVLEREFQQATSGRYLKLAEENIAHFSNVPIGQRNIDVWRSMHTRAILEARQANTKPHKANRAWAINASADHFLMDAFSGGHLRVPREQLHKQGFLGDVKSKLQHDANSEAGVEVENRRGDRWTAYGDGMLDKKVNAKNASYVLDAVRLSRQDVAQAISEGNAYPLPTPETRYSAEAIVPIRIVPYSRVCIPSKSQKQ